MNLPVLRRNCGLACNIGQSFPALAGLGISGCRKLVVFVHQISWLSSLAASAVVLS